METAIEVYNANELTPVAHPTRGRKKKSKVWEHFTIETISPGCRRACCKGCKQTFAYSTGTKVAGTSHLKRHIVNGSCPALSHYRDEDQLTPYTPRTDPPKRRYRTSSSPYVPFNHDNCRREIAKMIIMNDYPLHMVEDPGFIDFVQRLQPRFNRVSFNTAQGDSVALYLAEKNKVMKSIDSVPGRFCLALDLGTSDNDLAYVFITGHFIDSDWKLQRKLLNVLMEPYPESDKALSHAVATCVSDWCLEGKLFSIIFNHPTSEAGIANLRPLLCVKNPLILSGQLLVGNCIARTFSSIAEDVLVAGKDVITKVRDGVKFVKTSEAHEVRFFELKQQLQVPSESILSLDDETKWNTTYQMLTAASELKEVFSCLDTSDPDYKQSPSMEDWRQVETFCSFLKPLHDALCNIISTNNPPAVTLFHEVWKIQSDLSRAISGEEDPFISNIAKTMKEKIYKYWRDCSLFLAMAVVMDPRFKMKLVEFSFSKLYSEDSPAYIKVVDDSIHELFNEYSALPLPLTPAYAEGGENSKHDGLTDFDMYIMETTGGNMKSELDQYLDEPLLPRVQEFDVLDWWKQNKLKYPTLSRMARDILTIPVSAAAFDAVFDTETRKIDSQRSNLRPETLEALICAKEWLQSEKTEDFSDALVVREL